MAGVRKPDTGDFACTGCGAVKDVSEFRPRRRGDGSKTWAQPCKECQKVRVREWQLANPDKCREQNRRANAKRMPPLTAILREAKSQPCVDCGIRLPWQCMDLDHVRGAKVRTIGNATGFNAETLRAEIAKCEIRCPTCHRLRHFNDSAGGDLAEAA